MPTTTTSPLAARLIESGLASLDFIRGTVEKLLDATPAGQHLARPGGKANHALWIVGHLACTDDFFLRTLAGQERGIPESWDGLFGMGSEPSDDAKDYPRMDEVRAAMADRRAALRTWLATLDEKQLAAPLPAELEGFAPDYAALMGAMAAHEGMHAGQLTVIRRCAGLPFLYGG